MTDKLAIRWLNALIAGAAITVWVSLLLGVFFGVVLGLTWANA